MAKFIREGYVSAELSEEFAGYYAHLLNVWNDGRQDENRIPFRTKEEAEECLENFLSGSYK